MALTEEQKYQRDEVPRLLARKKANIVNMVVGDQTYVLPSIKNKKSWRHFIEFIQEKTLEKIEYAAFHGLGMDPHQMGGARFNGVSACSEPWKKDGVPSDVGCPAFTKIGNVKAEDMPPFPSVSNYDAKAWKYMKEHASEGALFWNVSA